MDDITKKTMEQIKNESIVPKAKIYTTLQKYFLWSFVSLAVLLGSFSFAIIYYVLINSDLDILFSLNKGYVFKVMPLFWILSFVLFIALGRFTYAKTAFGYRYGVVKVAAIFLSLTIFLGALLSIAGIPKHFQNIVRGNSFMDKTMSNQIDVWSRPNDGFLSGNILSVEDNILTLKDFNGKLWLINTENSIIRGRVSLLVGGQIKVIGKAEGDVFNASDIRPWIGGMGQGKNKMR